MKGFDMGFDFGVVISIISAVVALASALFAWQAVRAAEKTYSVELIGQLYATYQSDEMLRDLKIVWGIYRQLWESDSLTKEMANEKVNEGVPIREDLAIDYFNNLDVDSPEFRAIHNIINFWTYVELLLQRKALSLNEILAFTSHRILGFLIPMAKAYDVRYGQDYEVPTLKYANKVLRVAKKKEMQLAANRAS
jgi:hypothetical protein